mmetsp:Transcript_10383/g.29148  ORF Transcript_10383/g.29148 Transcript_10383/m.29148 type:complete len:198 (+) Transcript_10383:156-749(+)
MSTFLFVSIGILVGLCAADDVIMYQKNNCTGSTQTIYGDCSNHNDNYPYIFYFDLHAFRKNGTTVELVSASTELQDRPSVTFPNGSPPSCVSIWYYALFDNGSHSTGSFIGFYDDYVKLMDYTQYTCSDRDDAWGRKVPYETFIRSFQLNPTAIRVTPKGEIDCQCRGQVLIPSEPGCNKAHITTYTGFYSYNISSS